MANAVNHLVTGDRSGGPEPSQRGIAHLMHPNVLGCLIGAVGATAFVLVNRAELPSVWSGAALGAWAVVLAVFGYAVLMRPRVLLDPGPPHPAAGAVYVGGVVGMLAAMALGRVALGALGRPELQPAVVVVAVGLHFVPFAWVFRVHVFARLGWSLTAIGIVGLALGAATGAAAVAGAAVLTGLVMLVLMALSTLPATAGSTSLGRSAR